MPQNDHPNVLLICTDHWPGSLLGCAGHPAVQTPTLDSIAANGVRFPNTYSECPVCVPARRTLMTGLNPHSHGMLENGSASMPDVTLLAQAFADAGYQTSAVGKLHVQPQRQRLGFDEVLIDEEGRGHEGCGVDDYELFLADQGHAGQRFASGMNNNMYVHRAWHLDESLHVVNWATRQMCRQLIRRDPLRPGFFYLSYSPPHPPLFPPRDYLDRYREADIDPPHVGDWIDGDPSTLPARMQRDLQQMTDAGLSHTPAQAIAARRAFYAQCTHIDHQLRVVIGTLRERGMLNDTLVCFTADHGDMLGNHRLWAKKRMYDDSARVPMIVMGTQAQSDNGTVGHHRVDDRLVGWADVMPTLLSLAGIDVPEHCQGRSMFDSAPREYVYGAYGDAGGNHDDATRMIRDPRFKLIYYPRGNHLQLFDMVEDPQEMRDLARSSEYRTHTERLSAILIDQFVDDELHWATDGRLTGLPNGKPDPPKPNRGLSGQRGLHSPPPVSGDVGWN